MGQQRAWGILLVGLICASTLAPPIAAAGFSPLPCEPDTSFEQLSDGLLAKQGQTTTAPVATFLPAEENAQFVFRHPPRNGTGSTTFRVFQTQDATIAKAGGTELPVLSVQPTPDGLVDGYKPSESVLLRVRMGRENMLLWDKRDFIVAACSDGQLAGWGLATARVSSPSAAFAVCATVALLTYLLATSAVWVSRRTPHALETKYPAVFSVRAISPRDFINPIHLTANAFNKASVQKFQVLLFSFLVGWLLLFRVLCTGELANLSATIVGLLGISGVGAATAQITYQQKTRMSFVNWAWLEKKGVLERLDPQLIPGPRWRDLVLTNREFDVYKLQTIIFSLAIACALIAAGGSNLSHFTVPETLLGILGLSQVVYIGGILVRPPAVEDLDQAINRLRAAGETLAITKARNTDTGPDGKLLDQLPAGQRSSTNAQRQYDELADCVEVMIESTLEMKVDRTKL